MRFTAALLLSVALVAGVAACGGGGGSSTTATTGDGTPLTDAQAVPQVLWENCRWAGPVWRDYRVHAASLVLTGVVDWTDHVGRV